MSDWDFLTLCLSIQAYNLRENGDSYGKVMLSLSRQKLCHSEGIRVELSNMDRRSNEDSKQETCPERSRRMTVQLVGLGLSDVVLDDSIVQLT